MSLKELLEGDFQRMGDEFTRISTEHKSPNEVAHHREEIVKNFLRKYLPTSLGFGKGEIGDSNGVWSGQVDIVIVGPYHPFTFNRETGRGLFFAEGVNYAIEVKSDISNIDELERGLRQIQKIKKLERKPTLGEMRFGSDYDWERLRRIPCILFAFRSPLGPTLKSNIQEALNRLRIPPQEAFDAIVVFDKGIIYNIKDPRDALMIYVSEQRKTGIVGCAFKQNTLTQFLLYLSYTIPWESKVSPVVLPYLQEFQKERVGVF